MIFAAFLIGLGLGVTLTVQFTRKFAIGNLRMDTTDPDGPYLFLELDKEPADSIYKKRYVTLRVKIRTQ